MRNARKRIPAALLAAALCAGLFTGCSGGEDTPPAQAQDGGAAAQPDAAKTVVRVQWIGEFHQEDSTDPVSGETRKGLRVVEDLFEKTHPDIDVQFIVMGWDDYQKKTQSMMMSGEADVYQAPGISALAEQGLLEPLQPYIDRDGFDLGVYLDHQVEGWKCVGVDDTELQVYGLPMIADTRYIMYDKQLFDDWGVPYLSAAPTVDEILDAAKKMTGKNPKTGEENFGIFYEGKRAGDTAMNLNEFYGGTWGTGVRASELVVNFDTPTMKQALDTMLEMNGYAPAGVMSNQGGELFGTEKNNIAIHLRAAPMAISNAAALGLSERYGVSRLFINEQEGMGNMFAGSPLVIAASSKVKDAAWEYLKFTSTPEFAQYFWENQRTEGLPCIKAALEFDTVKNDPNVAAVMDSVNYLWAPRYFYRSGQGQSILTTCVEQVLLNGVAPDKALADAQKEMDEWIAAQ